MINKFLAQILPILGVLLISWDASARSMGQSEPRPLVFIPGILGSSLVNSSGQFVWQSMGDLVSRLEELEYSTGLGRRGLRSHDVMRTHFFLGAWKSGSYEPILRTLHEFGFREGENLFVFNYDWRQSNFVTAEALGQFITENLANHSFNILAHSMGGIVSLIYAHGRPREHQVNRIVTVGTPYLGSLTALDVLINGPNQLRRIPQVYHFYDKHTVSRVILSFPSFFELLPAYEECCVLEVPDSGERKRLSILDAELWFRLNLLPAEYAETRLEARVRNALASRKEIDKLTQNWPADVEWIHIGGDNQSTPYQVRLKGYVEDYKWEPLMAGDGTVLWESAAPDSGRIVEPTAKSHQQILEEPRIVRWIERLLVAEASTELEVELREHERADNIEDNIQVYSHVYGRHVALGGVSLSIGEPYKASGELANVVVSLADRDRKPVPGVDLGGAVTGEDGKLWTNLGFKEDGHSYHSSFSVPDVAGIYTVSVELNERDSLEDFFFAYEASDSAELLLAQGQQTRQEQEQSQTGEQTEVQLQEGEGDAGAEIRVQQPQPQVTVTQPQPEVMVRVPPPQVTIRMPQPEVIVRMPEPQVDIQMAQPEVQVNTPQPEVQVSTPEPEIQIDQRQPDLQVQEAQPQIVFRESQQQATVQVEMAAPEVRFERSEEQLKVTVEQQEPQITVQRAAGEQGQQQLAAGGQQMSDQQALQQTEEEDQLAGEPRLEEMPASELIGVEVLNGEGETVAEIDDLVKEQNSKEVYAVLSVGGFLGIGDKRVVVPLSELRVGRQGEIVMVSASEDQLRDMPEFNQEGYDSVAGLGQEPAEQQ